jgi:carbon-monoxide dehydrogenase medium subunit
VPVTLALSYQQIFRTPVGYCLLKFYDKIGIIASISERNMALSQGPYSKRIPMKPAPFAYIAPSSLAEALAVMTAHGTEAKLLAGGQSLVPVMNFRLAQPTLIVDLNKLGELGIVRRENGVMRLGAMVRQRTLEFDKTIAANLPLLKETMPTIAHPQIRNRGTLGGSLAHADPAAELPVITVALNGRFHLQRQNHSRWLNAADFFTGLFTTALQPEEILTEVELPILPERTGYAFMELARRPGDYAQAGVAVTVRLDAAGLCQEARLVYLNVGEGPIAAAQTAASLQGLPLNEDTIRAAAEMAAQNEIEPTTDVHATATYKRHLAKVLTIRALKQAKEKAIG